MKPLTDLKRLALYSLLGLIALALVLWRVFSIGEAMGAAGVQKMWDDSERMHAVAGEAARKARDKRDEDARLANLITNLKVSEEHEQELAQLRRERDADRAAVNRAGGLRIPAPSCSSDRPGSGTPGAEAPGAGGRDGEAGPASVRLPEQVEDDLWALVDDADEVSAQLRSCQTWIRRNGFYGPETTASSLLLDRMIAAPNPPAEEAPQ